MLLVYALSFCLFVLYLAAIIALTANFGFAPPEFIQATLHLLGCFSAPMLATFFLPLLSLIRLSLSILLLDRDSSAQDLALI